MTIIMSSGINLFQDELNWEIRDEKWHLMIEKSDYFDKGNSITMTVTTKEERLVLFEKRFAHECIWYNTVLCWSFEDTLS